jgi:carbon monoxide dehydrogenase subunit G
MELINEFSVDAPVHRVWATVGDLQQVAGCLPGAAIDSVDGDTYSGHVAIKIGPIALGLAGTAAIVDRDDTEHRMVVKGSGRDRNGQGSAQALITVTAVGSGSRTEVRVVTDLELSGKIAQFGAGLIKQVSGRIVKLFVRQLSALVQADDVTASARSEVPQPGAGIAGGANGTPPAGSFGGIAAAALVAFAGAVFGWSLGRLLRPSLSAAR